PSSPTRRSSDLLRTRRPAALEHVLHHVDAAARGVALVTEEHVRGADCRTEAAVDASPQNPVDLRDARVLKLCGREIGLHLSSNSLSAKPSAQRVHAPWIENACRIEGRLDAAAQALSA